MSRLAPLTPETMSPDQSEVYNGIAAGARGGVRGPFTALLHSPDLAKRVEQLGVYVRFQCTVPERQRELSICIVAAHWKSDYEWFAHAQLALKKGVPAHVLDAIAKEGKPQFDDDLDAAAHRFAIELLHNKRVSDSIYDSTVQAFDERGVIDLTGLLGYYSLLAMTLNTFEVDVPEGAEIPWAKGA